jgi:hypothetical protein
MKTNILRIFYSILLSIVAGVGIASATGLNPLPVAGALFTISIIPKPSMSGICSATVYKEVWTGRVVEQLSTEEKGTFLDGIEDFSNYVSNAGDEMQVIHLVYMGVEPAVLINNTTYPIPITALDQEDIPISLDKYQTEVTPITDDEIYALSYDKIQVVKNKHTKAISKNKIKKSIHALAPGSETATMPILLTTGADDGTGRKRLVPADLIRLKKECDDLQMDDIGRRLVLCNDHVNDILLWDKKYEVQFYNDSTGKTNNYNYGFEFHQYVANPYFSQAKVKRAFGAVPVAGDRRASVLFSMSRAAKAQGWTKMYYSLASTDPQNQRNLVNFRHNFIVLPTREEGRAAIISANV